MPCNFGQNQGQFCRCFVGQFHWWSRGFLWAVVGGFVRVFMHSFIGGFITVFGQFCGFCGQFCGWFHNSFAGSYTTGFMVSLACGFITVL